jgi:hypothetical protein
LDYFYDEIVTTLGQSFSVQLSVDRAATDSGFYDFLQDSGRGSCRNSSVHPVG